MKANRKRLYAAMEMAIDIIEGKNPGREYTPEQIEKGMKTLAKLREEVEKFNHPWVSRPTVDKIKPRKKTVPGTPAPKAPPKPANANPQSKPKTYAEQRAEADNSPRTVRPKKEDLPTGSRVKDKEAKSTFLKRTTEWLKKK